MIEESDFRTWEEYFALCHATPATWLTSCTAFSAKSAVVCPNLGFLGKLREISQFESFLKRRHLSAND